MNQLPNKTKSTRNLIKGKPRGETKRIKLRKAGRPIHTPSKVTRYVTLMLFYERHENIDGNCRKLP